MSVPFAILEALEASGCTATQLMAAIRADRDERERRRVARARVNALAWNAVAAGLGLGDLVVVPLVDVPAVPLIADSYLAPAPADRSEPASGVRFTSPVPEAATETPAAVAQGEGRTGKGPARTALLMMAGLKPAARLVGAWLVDRCNLQTGRCDPSQGRLAADTGLSERSVRRAIAELIAAGLVRSVVHGSYGHRNAYVIEWAALAAASEAGQSGRAPERSAWAGAKGRTAILNEPDSNRSPLPNRTLVASEADRGVRQTLRRKPDPESGDGGHPAAAVGLGQSKHSPDRRQGSLLLPLPGGRTKAETAFGAAGSRLWQAVSGHLKAQPPPYVDAFGSLVGDREVEAATLAELRARGSGLGTLLRLISDRLEMTAVGPGQSRERTEGVADAQGLSKEAG